MKHSSTRFVARLSAAVLAALLLVGPAAAKPGNGHGKGQSKTHGQGSEEHGKGAAKREHGKAVRVAAKCPVHGKAHGQLVRSIAKNKEATVEDAQAACEAALADQVDEAV